MMQPPKYHFTIDRQSDLLADIDIWEPAQEGVFEPGHVHAYYEMLIFNRGGGTHRMGSDLFEVEDHSIHILKSNQFHELKRTTETDGFEIIFSDMFLHQLQQFDKKTNYLAYFSKSHVLNLPEPEFSELFIYFEEMIRNRGNKPIFYNLVSLIILKLIARSTTVPGAVADGDFQRALLELIQTHYREKRPLEFYAAKLNMSVNTLQRHTKAAFGKSVTELQNEQVIEEVKFLLTHLERPIKDIAASFNFTDESHLNHFFRKHIGISPSAYRKSLLV